LNERRRTVIVEHTGIVLAGGLGRRMGTAKVHLPFNGRPLVERIVGRLSAASLRVVVVVADGVSLALDGIDNVTVVADREPELGPLMGLLSGLRASTTELNFVVGCDMPFVDVRLLHAMAELAEGYDAVVPVHDSRPQPLHAVYRTECAERIQGLIAGGELRLTALAESVRTRYVESDEWPESSRDGRAFLNLNSPDDLARAERLALDDAASS
jgi:molybdopterin-guanine dinucleotide biosynthesis protein A